MKQFERYSYGDKVSYHRARAWGHVPCADKQRDYSVAWLTGVTDGRADNRREIESILAKPKKSMYDIAYLRGVQTVQKRSMSLRGGQRDEKK